MRSSLVGIQDGAFGLSLAFQGTLYLGHYFGCLKRTFAENIIYARL